MNSIASLDIGQPPLNIVQILDQCNYWSNLTQQLSDEGLYPRPKKYSYFYNSGWDHSLLRVASHQNWPPYDDGASPLQWCQ